jgi:CubicO group peptidase (beta-lactamase class C family)
MGRSARAQASFPGGDIEAGIARAFERLGFIPGLSVAAYAPSGRLVGAFGVTDVTTGERVTPDSAFYIASSTKPLTALALARMQARGDLDLSAPLSTLAPGALPPDVRPDTVRLRDLLTHTSGIDNQALIMRLAFTGQHDPSVLREVVAASWSNEEAPLGQFQYTNAGYNIATLLLEQASGRDWRALLQEEVFAPMGMRRSSTRMSHAERCRWSLAKGHWASAPEGIRVLDRQKVDQTMHSAGGVVMSANDAVRWLEAMIEDGEMHGRRLGTPALIASTRAPLAAITAQEDYGAHHYGLGWYLSAYRGEPMVHHFGDFDGFRAHVSYLPERRVGAAVFVNESSASWWMVHGVANYIYDRLTGQSDADARLEAAVNSANGEREEWIARINVGRAERVGLAWSLARERSAYAGAYRNGLFGQIELSVSGENLEVEFGQLRSIASAGQQPETVAVEFFPHRRGGLSFEGSGGEPDAVSFRGVRFDRMT